MMGATITPETMKPDSQIKRQHVPEDNLYVTVLVITITAVTMKITFWDMTRVD
jgi:hypothetical protein